VQYKQLNRPRTRPYAPNGLGGGSSYRFLPNVAGPTDADTGQTDVSVDPARRYDRTRPNASRTFLPATATATATSLNPALAGSPAAPPTTASSRLQRRPTVPVPVRPADRTALTPAVAYDGDLVVSRRTLAPGLVRRANAAPCVLLATAPGTAVPSNRRRQHSRCEAPLRLEQSSGLCALNLGAHCRALTQLDFSHGCRTLLNTSVLEHGLSHICLSREISSPVR